MNILIYGHHSHTGFGVVTESLGVRFVDAGHDVRILAVNARGEPTQGPLAGRIWPAAIEGDSHGGNISHDAIRGTLWTRYGYPEWKPDVVLVVADMSGLAGHLGPAGITTMISQAGVVGRNPWLTLPVFHYCPIEGDNLPPNWRRIWELIQPVAMAEYGAQVIADHIGRAVPMIYHGVDTEAFHPPSFAEPLRFGKPLSTREACRATFGLKPERKYVLRVDRLTERKFYHTFIETMVQVMRRDPLVDAIIHCKPVDPPLNLHTEIERLVPEDMRARFITSPYHNTFYGLPAEGLAALYSAADVLFSPTGGEGFGLTLAESLACETPVVCTGWAAEREVVAKGGILVDPLRDMDGAFVRYHSQYGMDWAVPDPDAFVEPLLHLLAKPAKRRALGREGRAHVVRNFSWDTAAAAFLALFEESNVDSAAGNAA